MIRTAFLTSIVLAFAIGTSTSAQTAGLFEVRFDLSNLTAQQQTDLEPALAETKRFWESVIVGYQPDLARSPQQNSQINSATFFGFFVAVMCHQRIGRPPCLTQFSCHAIP